MDHLQGKGDIYEAINFSKGRKDMANGSNAKLPGRQVPHSQKHNGYDRHEEIHSLQSDAPDKALKTGQTSLCETIELPRVAGETGKSSK